MIYPIESTNVDHNFNFYLKPIWDEGRCAPSEKDTILVVDAKLKPGLVRVCIDMLKEFEALRITSGRSVDFFYDQLSAKYGNLFPYRREDGIEQQVELI